DLIGDTAALGKAVGSDLKRAKATYPAMFGIEASRERAAASVQAAKEALRPLGDGPATAFLADLADFVLARGH
ncbi:MAG TPA: hypothetical protein VF234_09370, partial [Limnochordia bacterium]